MAGGGLGPARPPQGCRDGLEPQVEGKNPLVSFAEFSSNQYSRSCAVGQQEQTGVPGPVPTGYGRRSRAPQAPVPPPGTTGCRFMCEMSSQVSLSDGLRRTSSWGASSLGAPTGRRAREPQRGPRHNPAGASETPRPPGAQLGRPPAASGNPAWPSPAASGSAAACWGFRPPSVGSAVAASGHARVSGRLPDVTGLCPRLPLPGALGTPQGVSLEYASAVYVSASPHTPEANPGPAGGGGPGRAGTGLSLLGREDWSPRPSAGPDFGLGRASALPPAEQVHSPRGCCPPTPALRPAPALPRGRPTLPDLSQAQRGRAGQPLRLCAVRPCPTHCL